MSEPDFLKGLQYSGAIDDMRKQYYGGSAQNSPVIVNTSGPNKTFSGGGVSLNFVEATVDGSNTPTGELKFKGQVIPMGSMLETLTPKLYRLQTYSIPYSSSITPDILNGSSQNITLNGNLTINAVANSSASDEIEFFIIGDSLLRTISFNSAYKVNSAFTGSVAIGKTNYYSFKKIGATNWYMKACQEGLV